MDKGVPTEIAELAGQPSVGKLLEIEDSPRAAFVPVGGGKYDMRSIKPLLDEYLIAPERLKGCARVTTLESFITLVDRHKNEDSAVFACCDIAKPSLLAVVDYHTREHLPRFGEHTIRYDFPISVEGRHWTALNGKNMSQSEFAGFLEDRVADLASPLDIEKSLMESLFQTQFGTPAEVLQLSRGLQINVDAVVKEIRNIRTGEAEIAFEETHRDSGGQKLVVPGLFVVSIPLFEGDRDLERLVARLRYVRKEGKIVWSYHLYRPEDVIRGRLRNAFDQVSRETSLPVFEGAPEV